MAVKTLYWKLAKKGIEGLRLEEKIIPPLLKDQVLVKVEKSIVNPSDIQKVQGIYPYVEDHDVSGIDGSGTVVQSGGGEYAESLLNKRVSFLQEGAWSQYLIVNAERAQPLLENISFTQGSYIQSHSYTVHMLLDAFQRGNHSGFIQNASASALGQALGKWATKLKIPHINLVRKQEHVDFLKSQGAEHVFDTSKTWWIGKVKKLSNELGISCGFDCIGSTSTKDMLSLVKEKGIVYNVGLLSGQNCQADAKSLIYENKILSGLWALRYVYRDLSHEQRLNVSKLVQENHSLLEVKLGEVCKMEDLPEAINRYLERKIDGKLLLSINATN